jgi:hypothetical protein
MQDTIVPKRALQYRPSGKRDLGRPKKDGETQYEDGTGKMPNSWSQEEEFFHSLLLLCLCHLQTKLSLLLEYLKYQFCIRYIPIIFPSLSFPYFFAVYCLVSTNINLYFSHKSGFLPKLLKNCILLLKIFIPLVI